MTHPVLDPRLGVECTYGDPVTWREALDLLYGLLPEYADNLRAALEASSRVRADLSVCAISDATCSALP